MAAGLGFIEFTTGDILTAASANGYLASQTVMVFADAAARTSAIASPQEGMMSYLKDTNSVEYYSGSAWVAVGGSSSGPAFSAYRLGNQSVTNGVWTKIQMQTELFDTGNCFDNATTYRFTPTTSGKYQVSFQVFNGGAAPFGGIYKNGAEVYRTQQSVNSTGSVLIDMNGTTDYLEFYGLVSSSSIFEGGSLYTFAMATFIRS